MKKLLLVIDVQNDFINENTEPYVSKINDLINSNEYDVVAFTKYINSKDSLLYTKLNYKGCLKKEGQEIVIDTKDYKVFEKSIYSSLNNEFKEYISNEKIDEIYLCGFETDACVFKTALDLFESEYNVYVLKDYCMTHMGKDAHDFFIENLKRLIGNDSVI